MNIQDAKRLIPHPDNIINFNFGSCSPLPIPVEDFLVSELKRLHKDPVSYIWFESLEKIEKSRELLAKKINCQKNDLYFYSNVSKAVQEAVLSLQLTKDSTIIMSSEEYSHLETFWQLLKGRIGFEIKTVNIPFSKDLSNKDIFELFKNALHPEGDLLYLSHISSARGIVFPVKEICELARSLNIKTMIDGAHALNLVNLDITDIDPDYYASTGHKWMMAPVGSGFLYVRNPNPIQSTQNSDYSLYNENDYALSPEGMTYLQKAIEYRGTENRIAQVCLGAAIDFFDQIDKKDIQTAQRENKIRCIEILNTLRLNILTPLESSTSTHLVAFEVPDQNMTLPKIALDARQLAGISLHCNFQANGKKAIRISNSWALEEQHYTHLEKGLKKILSIH